MLSKPPKRIGRPPDGIQARDAKLTIASSAAWKRWVRLYSRDFAGSASALMDAAVRALAKERGYRIPPER